MPYASYLEYIDRELQFDTPVAFGLHPNAEITVKTQEAEALFAQVRGSLSNMNIAYYASQTAPSPLASPLPTSPPCVSHVFQKCFRFSI